MANSGSPYRGDKAQRLTLLALTFIVAGIMVLIALRAKALGPLESAVLQGVNVVLSIYGGIVFSRGERERAISMTAKSSARRVLVNYETLGRTAAAIEGVRQGLRDSSDGSNKVPMHMVDVGLNGLINLVGTQIASADAAVKDWRDLAPHEVDEEIASYRAERGSESNGADPGEGRSNP